MSLLTIYIFVKVFMCIAISRSQGEWNSGHVKEFFTFRPCKKWGESKKVEGGKWGRLIAIHPRGSWLTNHSAKFGKFWAHSDVCLGFAVGLSFSKKNSGRNIVLLPKFPYKKTNKMHYIQNSPIESLQCLL